MEKKKFKIGIMGSIRGRFVIACEKYLSDEMEVTALLENSEANLEEWRKSGEYKENIKVYSDFDEFIDSGIDAVILCNTFHEHYTYAMKAMEKGIAVLSETTAAPSLGACVELIECAERTKTKYMLGANCVYFRAVQKIKQEVESGKYGAAVYAEAEYCHPIPIGSTVNGMQKAPDPENVHWRTVLPRCYYNMHDLGPILYIMGKRPVRVVGKAIVRDDATKTFVNFDRCLCLVELEDGSVINYSGCTGVGALSKWYRVDCKDGSVESVRHNTPEDKILINPHNSPTQEDLGWDVLEILTDEDKKRFLGNENVDSLPHNGVDFFLMLHFLKYLRGESEPAFDVYRAVDLSVTAIVSWYSILSGSKELDIPDLRKPEDREKVRGDYRMPFVKRLADQTLPSAYIRGTDFEIGF
ncbi:MAG: Gfo/Idh/MocA family oxidoreductase [Ruminococcaceae bacterium]|nr:Gfo/Idh/MocA family oxidoreductase [Oscillospiraceae bacterium]